MSRLLPLLLLLTACASDARVEGTLRDAREGVVAVRWGPAGSGLVHGQGEALGEQFWVGVAGSPPPAAFHQGAAVGELVLLGKGASVRLGAPLDDVRGVAERVALVHRTAELGPDTAWAQPFTVGLSCATERDGTWVPAECQALGPLSFD